MQIIAFDTTAKTASVAAVEIENGEVLRHSVFSVKNKLKHSETLLHMLDSVLSAFDSDISQIDLIGVSVGPGSFTGVRIGITTAKGLAFPKDLPCAPVSALEALALNVSETSGLICPVMDARRNQFYNALFRFEDGKLERLTPDRAIDINVLKAELESYGEKVTVCGDGAYLLKGYNDASLVSRDQNALSVALCAYQKHLDGKTVAPSVILPVYLRQSQPEQA